MTRRLSIAIALALPVLFACGSTTELIPTWEMRVEGLVLEYTDSTLATTVPVSGAHVSLFLPEGADAYCLLVLCDIEVPGGTTTDGGGRFFFTLLDPAACTLRIQANVTASNPLDGTEVRKTAEAPRVAPDCREGQVEGPTLILREET
ncbi:MAG: hypothetical protein O3B84_03000 [Chloroflexi bacterium]|nr:hypothetical protein [Chloroflexota bacterium]